MVGEVENHSIEKNLKKLASAIESENKDLGNVERFLHDSQPKNDRINQMFKKGFESVGSLIQINKALDELTNEFDSASLLELGQKLDKIEENREEMAENIFNELYKVISNNGLKNLGLKPEDWNEDEYMDNPPDFWSSHNEDELKQLFKHLKEIEEEIEEVDRFLEKALSKALSQARDEFYNRPKMIFEKQPLENFLTQVRNKTLNGEGETGGIFYYERVEQGLKLKEFEHIRNIGEENRDTTYKRPEEQKKRIRKKHQQEKFITAHSHPPKSVNSLHKKYHSSQDRDSMSKTLEKIGLGKAKKDYSPTIDVLAAPDEEREILWIIPEVLKKQKGQKTEEFRNLPVKADKRFPQLELYNKATVEAIARGADEFEWSNYVDLIED